MNAKHTPGPWTVSHPAISFQITAGKIHVADAFAKVSAGISDKYILESEAEANARLIAAAPDLLDACKQAVKRYCGCHNTEDANWHGQSCPMPVLIAAIAKAEGNQ